MFKAFIVDRKTKAGVFLAPYPADVMEHLKEPDNFLWIDFYQPNYDWIRKNFKIHHHIIELCKDKTGFAYYEPLKEYFFLKTLVLNPEKYRSVGESGNLNLIVSKQFILTFHESYVEAFDAIDADPDELSKIFWQGTDHFLYYLLNILINDYSLFTEKINNDLNLLEHQLFNNPKDDFKEKIFNFEHTIISYQLPLKEQRRVMSILYKNPPAILKKSSYRFIDRINYKINSLIMNFAKMEKNFKLIQDTYSVQLASANAHRQRVITAILLSILIILFLWSIALPILILQQFQKYLGFGILVNIIFLISATYFCYRRFMNHN